VKGWKPENYGHQYYGPVTLTQALALSLNTVSVRLTLEVTPQSVVRTAHRLGIASHLEPNASIALGTSEVSVLELTGAYASFANGGFAVSPHVIERITAGNGRRQDRHLAGFPRRLVRRIHRTPCRHGLARQRRRRAHQTRHRRRAAGRDLEPLHACRAPERADRRAALHALRHAAVRPYRQQRGAGKRRLRARRRAAAAGAGRAGRGQSAQIHRPRARRLAAR